MDEYRFVKAMANVNDLSLSRYLKEKLFEPKNKLSEKQLDKVMSAFSKKVDILTLSRMEAVVIDLNGKYEKGQLRLTKEESQELLKMQHSLNQIHEGVSDLCRLFL